MTEPARQSMQANIGKYYVFHFFLNFQLWWPIWVIYLTEERGLSLSQVTLIDVPFWISIILLQVPGAAIADRFGRKPTLIASAAIFAVAIILFGLASNFWLILGSYLAWGVSFSLLYGTESAFIYDTLKSLGREDEYPRAYGRAWAIATAASLGGTLLGAPVAAATSLSFPIILSGLFAALAALAALTFREPLREVSVHGAPSYPVIIRDSLDIARSRPAVRYAILFFGVITIGSIAPIFFFQPFLVRHGVDLGQVGFWQTPMRIAAIGAALGAHRIIVHLGERRTFYLMPLVLIGSYALLAAWDSVYAQVAFPMMNFVVILSQPTITNFVNRRVESERRATIVSLTNLTRSMVLIPTAPALGALSDGASPAAAYLAGGVIIAAAALPVMLLWLPFLRRAGEEEAAAGEFEPVAAAPLE